MLFRLFLLFSVVPIIELYLLIQVGRVIGALPTVLLLLAISAAGAWLVRNQGFAILRSIQNDLGQGRLPAGQLLDGALILTGGILLLTPGFFTDFLGLFFLFPATRLLLKQALGRYLERRLRQGVITVQTYRR